MVVIDDQPEVTNLDVSFLYESNEGFQEVSCRKGGKKARLRSEMLVAQEKNKAEALLKEKRERKDVLQSKVCVLYFMYF